MHCHSWSEERTAGHDAHSSRIQLDVQDGADMISGEPKSLPMCTHPVYDNHIND